MKIYRKFKDGKRFMEVPEKVAEKYLGSYYKDPINTLKQAKRLATDWAVYEIREV